MHTLSARWTRRVSRSQQRSATGRRNLEALIKDWRDLLAEHAVKTRKILRKLLTKRIHFIPETRDGVRGYRLEAEGTLQPFFAGLEYCMISREGYRGALCEKGVVQTCA